MRTHRQLAITALILLALTLAFAPHIAPIARAQDGEITFNEPEIINLDPTTTTRRSFTVLEDDTVEIALSPLAQFTYSAVLIDPANTPLQLTPTEDGSISASITNAPAEGTYTLVLQATDAAGQLLVQVNNTPPIPLTLGITPVELTSNPQRFSLAPDPAQTTLSVQVQESESEPGLLPALTLVNTETGDELTSVQADAISGIMLTLPSETGVTLQLQGSESPVLLTIEWLQLPIEDTADPPAPASDDSSSATESDSSASSSTCEVVLNAPVNVRAGPDTSFATLGVAPGGSSYPALAHNGDFTWYQVNYNGQSGWIAMFIAASEAVGNCDTLPSDDVLTSGSGTPTITYTPSLTYTPGGPTVTHTPTPTHTYTPSPSYTPGGPTLTYTPTATRTQTLTPTSTASATTQQLVDPTATYTPSYTPTTPPAAQVAPEDARFNAPLNIPLDNTTSVLDFVSYPGGDQEDRVRWDITGMNQNSALSGGRARLVIAVSCFGENTDQVTFFTGGQTFFCGQTIVDREVTYASRTGSVVIQAVGGTDTYVQWVLTGTATRLN